jgi:hypothetical protein
MQGLYASAHVEVKRKCLLFPERSRIFSAMAKRKNQAAVELGRKGGKKGGPARAANMTAEERSESARNAVLARWAKYYEEKDDKKRKS